MHDCWHEFVSWVDVYRRMGSSSTSVAARSEAVDDIQPKKGPGLMGGQGSKMAERTGLEPHCKPYGPC
jgi:hypothetical protein